MDRIIVWKRGCDRIVSGWLVERRSRSKERGDVVNAPFTAEPFPARTAAPIFLLVPLVKLPKRLDLARDAGQAHEAVPDLIVAKWVEER